MVTGQFQWWQVSNKHVQQPKCNQDWLRDEVENCKVSIKYCFRLWDLRFCDVETSGTSSFIMMKLQTNIQSIITMMRWLMLYFSTVLLTLTWVNACHATNVTILKKKIKGVCLVWLNATIVNWQKSPINRLKVPKNASHAMIIKQAPPQQRHIRKQGKELLHKAPTTGQQPKTMQAPWWQWYLELEDLVTANQNQPQLESHLIEKYIVTSMMLHYINTSMAIWLCNMHDK